MFEHSDLQCVNDACPPDGGGMTSLRSISRLTIAVIVLCTGPFASVSAAQSSPVDTTAAVSSEAGLSTSVVAQSYYWGAWIDEHLTGTKPPWDMAPAAMVEKRLGKSMSLLEFSTPMAYANGTQPFTFPVNEMTAIRNRGSIPFFSWSTHAMRNFDNPAFSLQAIAAGRQDTMIRAWAMSARGWGKPFFLRFNWEANSDWFPWGNRWKTNTDNDYVQAWRHVHQIFTAAGATNAKWVWCPTADPFKVLGPLAGLYPGNDYVDWTCADVYNGGSPWRSFSQVLGGTYQEIAAIAPSKPMLLGEVGTTETGGSKAAWINDMFASLPVQFPLVRGLIWFDSTVTGPGGRTDWPLDSSSSAYDAFARGVAPPQYRAANYSELATITANAP